MLNGMIRILGKHGNFNRIEFGSALWNSVRRPTTHGCSIWFPSSAAQKDILESLPKISFNEMVKTYLFKQRTNI
jgi:hypothetical protein